jgi:hypothetical protein
MDLIADLFGTQETAGDLWWKDRMNEKMGEGLAHEVQQRYIMLLLPMQIQGILPL